MNTTPRKSDKPDKYREWFDREVSLGLADLEAGRVVSHESVMADAEKLIVKHAKHRKKAA
ncbi:MAG: hypothetical protein PHX38_02790 [Sulfuricella sp.]|nr:hypothetical protein [Sulfuricella sp.]